MCTRLRTRVLLCSVLWYRTMRRRGQKGDRRRGTRRNVKSHLPPGPPSRNPDTVWACEVTCSQLLSPNPDWHETRRHAAACCWALFRGPGPPTSGKGLGCRAVGRRPPPKLHLQYILLTPSASMSGSSNCPLCDRSWREGSLITCPRPDGPVNVTFLPPPSVWLISSRVTAGWPSSGSNWCAHWAMTFV